MLSLRAALGADVGSAFPPSPGTPGLVLAGAAPGSAATTGAATSWPPRSRYWVARLLVAVLLLRLSTVSGAAAATPALARRKRASPGHPRVAVITLAEEGDVDGRQQEHVSYPAEARAVVERNRRRYCNAHGYTCILSAEELYAECKLPPASHLVEPRSWLKIPALLACSRFFSFSLWLDADAVFVDFGPRVEALGCDGRSALWVGGNDCDPAPHTNAGLLVATPRSERVLLRVLEWSKANRYDGWWEQGAINTLLMAPDDPLARDVCVLPARLQAFEVPCMPRRPGVFVFHAAGCQWRARRGNGTAAACWRAITDAADV